MTSSLAAGVAGVTGLAAVCSWLLVGAIRRYALRRQMVDRPGARTSHRQPTPRGGGAGVVAVVVGIGLVAAFVSNHDWRLATALGGVTSAGIVGWLDDRGSLGVRVRLTAHLLSALLLLPLAASLPAGSGYTGGIGLLWWIFWGVSSINIVNFMDGIDGLVGLQVLVVGAHVALLGAAQAEVLWFAAGLVGGSAGFLLWNWSPARIFLGDSGSGALGLACVVGGLLVMRTGAGLVVAFLPLCPIFLDATATLLRRIRRRERITDAHRSHLYQRLANGGWGHARVSTIYGALAAGALPVAVLPARQQVTGVWVYFAVVLAAAIWLEKKSPGET